MTEEHKVYVVDQDSSARQGLVRLLGKAGVHVSSTYSGFSLEGEFVVNGEPETGKIGDKTDFVAAFPLIGVVLNYHLGRRLIVENVVDFVYLPVGNTQALALRTQLGCRYMFAP